MHGLAQLALSDKNMGSMRQQISKMWSGDPWWFTKSPQGSSALHYNNNMVFIIFTLIPSHKDRVFKA